MGGPTQMDHFLEDFDPACESISPHSFGLSVREIEQKSHTQEKLHVLQF